MRREQNRRRLPPATAEDGKQRHHHRQQPDCTQAHGDRHRKRRTAGPERGDQDHLGRRRPDQHRRQDHPGRREAEIMGKRADADKGAEQHDLEDRCHAGFNAGQEYPRSRRRFGFGVVLRHGRFVPQHTCQRNWSSKMMAGRLHRDAALAAIRPACGVQPADGRAFKNSPPAPWRDRTVRASREARRPCQG
jgi:hypothetical protein